MYDIHNMLTEAQLQVLGYLAYTGTSMSERTLSSFCSMFELDRLKAKAIQFPIFQIR